MLHNLKEAPDSSGDGWSVLPAGPLQKCRVADTAAEVNIDARYHLSLRQFAGCCSSLPDICWHSCTCRQPAPFTLLTGCGLHCRQGLLPRGRKIAPETQRLNTAPDPCVTLTAQSGKVTHAALSTCTRKLNCASLSLDSETAFSGHLTNKKNMNRYQRRIRMIRG